MSRSEGCEFRISGQSPSGVAIPAASVIYRRHLSPDRQWEALGSVCRVEQYLDEQGNSRGPVLSDVRQAVLTIRRRQGDGHRSERSSTRAQRPGRSSMNPVVSPQEFEHISKLALKLTPDNRSMPRYPMPNRTSSYRLPG